MRRLSKPIAVPKQRPSILLAREKKRAQQTEEERVRALVKKRDFGMCRVAEILYDGHDVFVNAHRGSQMHHITPRSLGGKSTTQNCVWICDRHHQDRHFGVIKISGNGDKAIFVERVW